MILLILLFLLSSFWCLQAFKRFQRRSRISHSSESFLFPPRTPLNSNTNRERKVQRRWLWLWWWWNNIISASSQFLFFSIQILLNNMDRGGFYWMMKGVQLWCGEDQIIPGECNYYNCCCSLYPSSFHSPTCDQVFRYIILIIMIFLFSFDSPLLIIYHPILFESSFHWFSSSPENRWKNIIIVKSQKDQILSKWNFVSPFDSESNHFLFFQEKREKEIKIESLLSKSILV